MTTNDNSPNNQPTTPKRKRGAPLGNHNAVKHGFYAKHFTPQEVADFSEMKPLGVYDEIQLIRALMRRLFASLDQHATHEELLETFRIICLGNFTLNRLIRTQIYGPLSPLNEDGYNRMKSLSNNNPYFLGDEDQSVIEYRQEQIANREAVSNSLAAMRKMLSNKLNPPEEEY